MRKLNLQSIFILFITSVVLFTACSDDNSTNIGEPPALPDLSTAVPDLEYFQTSNKLVQKSNGENFLLAKSLTYSMQSLIVGFSSVPESFMSTAQNEEASFANGVWLWDYTASYANTSISIELTAEETNSQIDWAMYLSLNSPEISFDNYKYFDGSTQNNGKTGEWSFYPFYEESTTPVMTYDWNIESDDEASFTITFDQDSESSSSTFGYVKSSPNNTITISSGGTSTTIYWNDSTQEGYYQPSGETRVCWDANSNNTPCATS